jgi:hypothetical protein
MPMKRRDSSILERILMTMVIAMISALCACAPSAEELEQERDKQYLSQVAVAGFEKIIADYGQNAYAIYFGPSSLNPSTDVSAPELILSVPPKSRSAGRIYDTVADGYGVSDDGVQCFVVVERSRPGGPQLDYWRLTDAQSEMVESGSHVILEVGVVCGGPK